VLGGVFRGPGDFGASVHATDRLSDVSGRHGFLPICEAMLQARTIARCASAILNVVCGEAPCVTHDGVADCLEVVFCRVQTSQHGFGIRVAPGFVRHAASAMRAR